MTAAVEPVTTAGRNAIGPTDARHSAWLLVALAVAVLARYVGTATGMADGTTIGLAFGITLLAVATLDARGRPGRGARSRLQSHHVRTAFPPAAGVRAAGRSVAIGLLGGVALVGLALLARALGGSPIGPSMGALAGVGLLAGWTVATIVVAGGEEALLRGALFDRIESLAGPWWAIALTSLAFALMHVPFYGWHVVPLDLGVGIWLAGLRLETGGVVAPWLAHAIADLATWWL